MIRKKFLVVLLTLGTVGGYALGFAGLGCRAHARRQAFEEHVARVCVDAARSASR
jgi:hypothetical protein